MIEFERPIRLGPINIPLDALLALMVPIGAMFAFSFWVAGGFRPSSQGNITSFGQMDIWGLWASGADGPRALYEKGEWWRLFTAIFLHGGIMHLVMNCWSLHVIGKISIAIFAPTRTVFAFLACGVTASIASSTWMYFRGGTVSVGASGAVLGLIGFVLVHLWTRQDPTAVHYRRQLLQWSVMILIFGFVVEHIDNAAHIGGFVAGFALGRIVRPAGVDINGVEGPVIRTATLLLAVATIVALSIGIVTAKERFELSQTTISIKEFVRTAHNALLSDKTSTELNSGAQLSRNGLSKMKTEFAVPKAIRAEALEILESPALNILKVARLSKLLDRARDEIFDLAPDLTRRRPMSQGR